MSKKPKQYVDTSNRGKYAEMHEPRTHQNCTARYGVNRPGKTAVDKARRKGDK